MTENQKPNSLKMAELGRGKKHVDSASEYRWGDTMTVRLRSQLEREVEEANEQESGVTRRDLSGLQEMSNADLFLLWLRS